MEPTTRLCPHFAEVAFAWANERHVEMWIALDNLDGWFVTFKTPSGRSATIDQVPKPKKLDAAQYEAKVRAKLERASVGTIRRMAEKVAGRQMAYAAA